MTEIIYGRVVENGPVLPGPGVRDLRPLAVAGWTTADLPGADVELVRGCGLTVADYWPADVDTPG